MVPGKSPSGVRGRVSGLYSMSALGMRTFSGITVGLVGSLTGVHWSLFGSAVAMFMALVYLRSRTGAAAV